MTMGGDQELIAALRTPTGEVWGALGLYREPGVPLFKSDELEFVRSLAPWLAEGARRGLLVGEATDPEGPESPGLVVLTESWNVESVTPGVERWLAEVPDGDWDAGRLPAAVYSVAGRALRTADSRDEGRNAPGRRHRRTGAPGPHQRAVWMRSLDPIVDRGGSKVFQQGQVFKLKASCAEAQRALQNTT